MKRLFDKSTGLSIYGATVLMVLLVGIAAVIGLSVERKTEIDPETDEYYKYTKSVETYEALNQIKENYAATCGKCHKAEGKGPVKPGDSDWDKFKTVMEEYKCPGYKYDKNRCDTCHVKWKNDPMEFDQDVWRNIASGDEEHPEVVEFHYGELTGTDLQAIYKSRNFKYRWTTAEWFAVILTILSVAGFCVFLGVKTFRKKEDPRWLEQIK